MTVENEGVKGGEAEAAAKAAADAAAAAKAADETKAADEAKAREAAGGEQKEKVTEVEEKDWRDDRIAKLTAKLREAQTELGKVRASEEVVRGEKETDAQFDARVQKRALELAQEQQFNNEANAVAEKGRKDFPDFDDKLKGLVKVIDVQDPASVQAYKAFLDAAIATGQGAKIIHMLGGNLNEASRILALSPTRMGVEVAKLASREPETVSNAAKPITPVGGRGAAHTGIAPDDPERADQLSTAEWFRRRQEQVDKSARR